MSTKHARHSPSSASPPAAHGSKLPKFLQKQAARDRAKSISDPPASASSSSLASGSSSSASSPSETPAPPPTSSKQRRNKLSGLKEKDEPTPPSPISHAPDAGGAVDEPPVIVEPIAIPRPRTRSERPISVASDLHPSASFYASTSSTSRIGDLPTRLSGWFAQTFSTSSTDLSLPNLLSQGHLAAGGSLSPGSKGKGSALLTAAKHGKGHLDKAVRYLLDSDSTPDKCVEPIWLLGVQHTGYEPPPPPPPVSLTASTGGRRSSIDSRRRSPPSFRSSTSSSSSTELSQSQTAASKHPGTHWPPVFYADFTTRIWLTYRSQFTAIRDLRLADLQCGMEDSDCAPSSPPAKRWNWGGGEKGWTTDAGWGCMLRTGQSLLANALLHMQLGRDWRCPPYPVMTADYATYVQILTWFFDSPSPEAPFSVHRMALAGKELGKDVGQWFGPSTAAGAIKQLVVAFPEAGLGVSVGADGAIFQSDVYAASHAKPTSPRKTQRWGGRPVLVLIGLRLGLDGVNPIYYDTIKALFTFPQTVGIAGGRPKSSYYFVGSQADNLFYLDPHHARPAIILRPAPPAAPTREATPESDCGRRGRHARAPTSPASVRTGSSTFSYHAPLSPSPLQQQYSTSSTGSSIASSVPAGQHTRWPTTPASPGGSAEMDARELGGAGLDPVQEHYATAYSAAELKTFHCERVRKMPMSGLDPSMLLGFLCRDEADWLDFRRRVGELAKVHKTIFAVQDEPPHWPSDSDDNMGLESISEPDDTDESANGDGDEADTSERFFDSRSRSASVSSRERERRERGPSEEVDTEEDPVDPVTPGASSRFELGIPADDKGGFDGGFEDDIEDDWVDPSLPTPLGAPAQPEPPSPAEVPALAKSRASTNSGSKKKKGRKSGQTPVPVPTVRAPVPPGEGAHYPFPAGAPAEHYPFPRTSEEGAHARTTSGGRGAKRMHTARARDGGRTQSGGVKGIVTED